MTNFLGLPHELEREALTCRAIAETPRGHRSKFAIDRPDRCANLARVQFSGKGN
jgi:hypothetical protein